MENGKVVIMTPFHILFKMTLTYLPTFLHYFFIFKQLYKMTLFMAVIQTYMKTNSKHQGRKKQGHNV
jgi:hypothetical protein